MAKTLASQAKNGGSIPLARFVETGHGRLACRSERGPDDPAEPLTRAAAADVYQACSVPQCGHPTDVVTAALNAKPHLQA